MKYLSKLLSMGAVLFFIACQQENIIRPNGWYYITSGVKDSLSKEPILAAKDFGTLRLDSFIQKDGMKRYLITGRTKENKIDKWANATEKSIGHSIGFVYNGKTITAPYVNARIESGNFQITIPENEDQQAIFNALQIEANVEKGN